jgi:hypothetical protein
MHKKINKNLKTKISLIDNNLKPIASWNNWATSENEDKFRRKIQNKKKK